MKQKQIKAIVERRYAEALARAEAIRADAQRRLDEDTAQKLGALCLDHRIEVYPSDDDAFDGYIHLVTYDRGCGAFRYRLRKPGFARLVDGRPCFSEYFDVIQSDDSCIRFLLRHREDIMDSLNCILSDAMERYLCDPDCHSDAGDAIAIPPFFDDASAFISCGDREFIRSISKESIRMQVIAEGRNVWLRPEPPHHARNNATVRGPRVPDGRRDRRWKAAHDELDKMNRKRYREGSGKYDSAAHSRKERRCSEIRAHKRNLL